MAGSASVPQRSAGAPPGARRRNSSSSPRSFQSASAGLRLSRLVVGVGAFCALLTMTFAGIPTSRAWAASASRPFAAAVLPFEDRRHAAGPTWLGHYLAERIDRALVRSPQVAVLPPDAARAWAAKLRLRVDAPPGAEHLRTMGVQVIVQGATQEVLGLTELRIAAHGAGGALMAPEDGLLRVHLRESPPAAVLGRVLGLLETALVPGTPLRDPRPPAGWEDVQRLYGLLGEPLISGDRAARPERVARLKPWITHPTLGGRAHEALAGLLLEQALLYLPEGAGQQRMLGEALQHATAALADDPGDTRRQALKAELHYFLRQFYEAKTEASVARIRNPLESLAFVVLGLEAGLATGQAAEQLGRAVAMHPFLRTEARPAGWGPYQGGVLEPYFRRWEELRQGRRVERQDANVGRLAQAIALFEARRFDEAEPLFRTLAQQEEGDVTPWVYLNRMLIELGQPGDAVVGLRRLAAENPQEPDVLHFLGVALAASGEPALAAEYFRKALVERPDDARSHLGLADAEMQQAHWPEALNALRAGLHAQPDNAEAWMKLGIVHLRVENWSAAEGALQQALSLRPDLEEAARYLAEARKHLNP